MDRRREPFDAAQGRPFDPAQGRPFDPARGGPPDSARGAFPDSTRDGSPDSGRGGLNGRAGGADVRPDGPPEIRAVDGPEPPRGSASAPIVLAAGTGAAAAPIGFVVIPINPPPVFVAIRELGPTLTWVG